MMNEKPEVLGHPDDAARRKLAVKRELLAELGGDGCRDIPAVPVPPQEG